MGDCDQASFWLYSLTVMQNGHTTCMEAGDSSSISLQANRMLRFAATYPHCAKIEGVAKATFERAFQVGALLWRPPCPLLSLFNFLHVDCRPSCQLWVIHHLSCHDIPLVSSMRQWGTGSRIHQILDMSAGHIALEISLLDDFEFLYPSLPARCIVGSFWIVLHAHQCLTFGPTF